MMPPINRIVAELAEETDVNLVTLSCLAQTSQISRCLRAREQGNASADNQTKVSREQSKQATILRIFTGSSLT
jgi:predicted kinase